MALNRGSQKQIAQRFKGNLDYFRKPHYWRRLRLWTILAVVLAGSAAMAVLYFGGPERMYNPGAISRPHAAFANDCAQCHERPNKTLAGASLKLTNHGIDARCEKCHALHSFHEPNVVNARSCTACHHEHEGRGPMAAPGQEQCLRCHGEVREMFAAAKAGRNLPDSRFERPNRGLTIFRAPRPVRGFTAVVTSFAGDHPEFRVVADQLRETNTLRFNHRRHLVETNDMPLVNGARLDCAACHQPGAGGAFFQRVSYERNCRACHSLQFDDRNPELTLPHGRGEHVRAFLRSLPAHYADLAGRQGITAQAEVEAFVARQMTHVRELAASGEQFEEQVFFAARRQSPSGRTRFEGCALCHEVTGSSGAPAITLPVLPDRWMSRGEFNHARHASVACAKCHDALRSADTADIIMPSKAACVECHGPKGKVSSDCTQCHRYHNTAPLPTQLTNLR